MRAPRARAPVVRCGTDRSPFLRAVPPPAQARGCKGRSPLHKITLKLPLPRRGRGQGGWGKEIKLKAGQAGGKEGKPPLRTPQRQGQPAIKQASTPCGHHSGKVSRQPAGQAPQRAPTPQVQPVPPPAQARGCKGLRPLHMKSKNLPLPAGKGGRGMGAGNKAKGRVGGQQRMQAPLRIPERQGQPATKNASPPADTTAARSAGDQPGKPPKNHSSASSSRKAVTNPRAAASSDASAKIRRRGSVPENRQITKELSAK